MKRVFGGMHKKSGTGPVLHFFAYIDRKTGVQFSNLHILNLHNYFSRYNEVDKNHICNSVSCLCRVTGCVMSC